MLLFLLLLLSVINIITLFFSSFLLLLLLLLLLSLFNSVCVAVLSRMKDLLPKMAAANEELMKKPSSEYSIETADEDYDGPVIEMVLLAIVLWIACHGNSSASPSVVDGLSWK